MSATMQGVYSMCTKPDLSNACSICTHKCTMEHYFYDFSIVTVVSVVGTHQVLPNYVDIHFLGIAIIFVILLDLSQ